MDEEKSHAGFEQKSCIVCGRTYETGALLLDTRMKQSLKKYNITGVGMCDEDQQRFDDGYTALVEINNETEDDVKTIKPEDAYRTGKIAHLRNKPFVEVFSKEPPKGGIVYVQEGVLEELRKMSQPAK